MKTIYFSILLLGFIFYSTNLQAVTLSGDSASLAADTTVQKHFNPFSLGADVMSRYIWRGTQFGGNSPSIQPYIEASYKNITLGAWGAYSTGGVHASQEIDLYLKVNFLKDRFTAILTDYYFPSDTTKGHISYDSKTDHVLETGLIFNGTDKFPISLSAYLNVYGHDAFHVGDDPSDTTTFNKEQGIQYSNYFEIAYNKTFANDMGLSAFLGFTFSNPKKADASTGYIGESGFYADGPGVVNVGLSLSKGIKITDHYSLPIQASFILNPKAQRVYFVFGISF